MEHAALRSLNAEVNALLASTARHKSKASDCKNAWDKPVPVMKAMIKSNGTAEVTRSAHSTEADGTAQIRRLERAAGQHHQIQPGRAMA